MLLQSPNGLNCPTEDSKTGGMIPEKLPSWLSCHAEKLASLGVFGNHIPNHVLVNEYTSGQGIMPHVDGPLFYPVVTTINLKSHTLLDFYHPVDEKSPNETDKNDQQDNSSLEERHFMSLLLEPRSLNILTEEMYTKYLHGIDERNVDILDDKIINLDSCSSINENNRSVSRGTRVSLTIRYVPKVLNVKLKFGRK
ncbi:alpha-ketoglutarate-dependent dioxygenase alkB homolog 6-like isoform X2 [Dendronephthya gigantea]|uniref:alpha-ketoglutarate-dependent dioxygenase alkB homolog 6-like isoform X2 n=1 Tax=Dendronephthya gigantea TaxID=151771 RepID=UPI00106BC58F|nr:alpha-ketoglutarate-dependent dioxygenase alkB homolog 6-like isoform X2 [Dendronephthya gigantea]